MVKRTPAIHLFCCANSVTETELEGLHARFGVNGLKILSLPCSGKATIPYLLKAFEKGADGVVMCACPESQCKHLEGSLRTSKRAEVVAGLLDEIGFGKGRILVVTKEQGRIEELIDAIQQLETVCSVPAGASEETLHGATTNEPARADLASVRASNRRENAA